MVVLLPHRNAASLPNHLSNRVLEPSESREAALLHIVQLQMFSNDTISSKTWTKKRMTSLHVVNLSMFPKSWMVQPKWNLLAKLSLKLSPPLTPVLCESTQRSLLQTKVNLFGLSWAGKRENERLNNKIFWLCNWIKLEDQTRSPYTT